MHDFTNLLTDMSQKYDTGMYPSFDCRLTFITVACHKILIISTGLVFVQKAFWRASFREGSFSTFSEGAGGGRGLIIGGSFCATDNYIWIIIFGRKFESKNKGFCAWRKWILRLKMLRQKESGYKVEELGLRLAGSFKHSRQKTTTTTTLALWLTILTPFFLQMLSSVIHFRVVSILCKYAQ